MNFQAAARAITGSKDKQEDAWRVYDLKGDVGGVARSDLGTAVTGGGLMLVADGIGGHHGGEVASKITADTFVKSFFSTSGNPEERLKKSLKDANIAIAEAQAKEPALKDMGATLVAGFFEGDSMSFVSVGDSLIYRYRDGELHRVNMDHSYFEIADREALGKDDRNLWKEVISRKGRDSITIAVLGRALEDFGHSPQIATRKVLPGDLMIFSSDGLETLSPVQIHNFIRELLPHGVGAVADGLIKAVDGIGGNRNYQDNATLVVLQADAGGAQATTTKITHTEASKTAPVAPKTAMIPPKAEAPQQAAAPGTISPAARSGKWSPTKFLLGFAVVLIAAAAVLYAIGVFGGGRSPQDATKVSPPPSDTTKVTPAPDGKNGIQKNIPRQNERQQSDSPAPFKQEKQNQPPASSPAPTREQNFTNPDGNDRKPVIIYLRGSPMLPAEDAEEWSAPGSYVHPRFAERNTLYAPADRYARYGAPYDCE